MSELVAQPLTKQDAAWVKTAMISSWGERVVSRGHMHYPAKLPGFVVLSGEVRVGLVTYHIKGTQCEIVTVQAFQQGLGVGRVMVETVREAAVAAGCQRLWLITTNDNTPAMAFYERVGFKKAAVHKNALEHSRKLKPEIPKIGLNGVPLRDEIEYEINL